LLVILCTLDSSAWLALHYITLCHTFVGCVGTLLINCSLCTYTLVQFVYCKPSMQIFLYAKDYNQ